MRVFVPFITDIVNFLVDGRVREMKLGMVSFCASADVQNMRTSFGAILTMSPSIPILSQYTSFVHMDCLTTYHTFHEVGSAGLSD